MPNHKRKGVAAVVIHESARDVEGEEAGESFLPNIVRTL